MKLATGLAVTAAVFLACPLQAQPQIVTGQERRVDQSPANYGVNEIQLVTLFQSKVHVFTWIENPPLGTDPALIRVLSRRDVAGVPFGEPVQVSTTPSSGGLTGLQVIARGLQIYAVWQHVTRTEEDVFYTLRFNRSIDGGATWEQDRAVTPPGVDARNGFALATGPSGQVYLAYSEIFGNLAGIAFRRSLDGGVSWSDPMRADHSPAGATRPSMAADGTGRIAILWRDGRPGIFGSIWSNSSTDSGASFQPNDTSVAGLGGLNMKVVPGGGSRFYAAFEAAPVSRVEAYFAQTADGGATWTAPLRIDVGTLGINFTSLEMTADTVGHVHTVVAYELPNANAILVYRASDDAGLTFRAPRRIDAAPPGTSVFFPKIAAAADGTVIVPWAQLATGTSPGTIWAIASRDFGQTWSPITPLSGSAVTPRYFPEISLDAGGAAVGWNQNMSPQQKLYENAIVLVPWVPGP